MTTSKALHHHLVALSQKGRRKKQPGKHQRINADRVVELAKVVLHSAQGTSHHLTTTTHRAAPTAAVKELSKSKLETTKETSVQDTSSDAKEATGGSRKDEDKYYPQLNQQLAQELQQLEEKRKQTQQQQVELWGVYKYALEKVSNLNDLRDAPDAILPGNFPKGEEEKDESQEARI